MIILCETERFSNDVKVPVTVALFAVVDIVPVVNESLTPNNTDHAVTLVVFMYGCISDEINTSPNSVAVFPVTIKKSYFYYISILISLIVCDN